MISRENSNFHAYRWLLDLQKRSQVTRRLVESATLPTTVNAVRSGESARFQRGTSFVTKNGEQEKWYSATQAGGWPWFRERNVDAGNKRDPAAGPQPAWGCERRKLPSGALTQTLTSDEGRVAGCAANHFSKLSIKVLDMPTKRIPILPCTSRHTSSTDVLRLSFSPGRENSME